MKALYEIAEVEIVKFSIEDIITTSSSENEDSQPVGGMGGENEGEPGGTFPGFE